MIDKHIADLSACIYNGAQLFLHLIVCVIHLKDSGIFLLFLKQITLVCGKNSGTVGTQERNVLYNNLAAYMQLL